MKNITIPVLLFLFSSLGFAFNGGTNLIDSCSMVRPGYKLGCTVAERDLDLALPYHAKVVFTYEYLGCDSRMPNDYLAIGIRNSLTGETVVFDYAQKNTFEMYGESGFRIVNLTGSKEPYRRHPIDCTLNISVTYAPSPKTLELFSNLEENIRSIFENIPLKTKEVAMYYSFFTSLAISKEVFHCLIEQYDDPIYDENLLVDLKNEYRSLYFEDFSTGKYQCPVDKGIEAVAEMCRANPLAGPQCALYSFYLHSKQWFSDQIRYASENFRHLRDQDSRAKVQNLIDTLNLAQIGL